MNIFSMFASRQQAVGEGGTLRPEFYRFLFNLFQSAGGGGPTEGVSVGASPFAYTAIRAGQIILDGGTVSKVEFSRDGSTWFTVGPASGMFLLKAQDQLRVTYSVTPTMTFVPS